MPKIIRVGKIKNNNTMNKKFLSLMTAILVVMMALYACKKDSGSSGGDDGNDPDNPFVGTWISDDLDGIILEVKASTWKIEFNGDLVYSGTYKPNGNSATLEITKINPEWADEDVEVGDKGTAKVSGKTLTVNFGDEDQTFTKKEEDPGDNLFIGTWISDEDENASLNITESTWKVDDDGYVFLSGTYTYKGNNADLTVNTADPEYTDLEKGDKGTAKVSGNKLTITFYGNDIPFTKEGGTPPPPPPPPGDDVYREPYLSFGVSKSTVKNYETRELYAEDIYQGYDYLLYLGENKDVQSVLYLFDANQYFVSSVCLNNTSNIQTRVFNFLEGKYNYVGVEDGDYYFRTSDGAMVIKLYYWADDDTWNVDYQDASYAKSSFPTIKKSIKADLLRSHK